MGRGGEVMIEIQCNSCHTRYRIDERVLPDDTPTFKCSRCGHVFSAEPRRRKPAPAPTVAAPPAKPPVKAPENSSPSKASEPPPESVPPADAIAQKVDEAPLVNKSRSAPLRVSLAQPPPAPPAKPATAATPPPSSGDLLAREFSKPSAPSPGEPLSFDFKDEPAADLPAVEVPTDTEWQVGNSNPDFESAAPPDDKPREFSEPNAPAFTRRAKIAAPPVDDAEEFPDESLFEVERGPIHSSAFFLALIFLMILGFGALTMLVCNAPAAAAALIARLPVIGANFVPPIEPAREVALRNVQMTYRMVKGGIRALVVTGTAENVGRTPLHLVQLTAQLLDSARRPLATAAVFCGNNLADSTLSEMTPREIDFYQKLQPPKNFVLQPLASSPFTVAFIQPVPSVSNLSLEVTQAIAAVEEMAKNATQTN
jgi:predicted Zn finger-like uncharacterized protein